MKGGWELTVLHLALGVAEPVDCCPMPTTERIEVYEAEGHQGRPRKIPGKPYSNTRQENANHTTPPTPKPTPHAKSDLMCEAMGAMKAGNAYLIWFLYSMCI